MTSSIIAPIEVRGLTKYFAAGTGLVTQLLGLGPTPTLTGVTVSIVRKARMGIWALIGTALLVQRGLAPGTVLSDPSLSRQSSRSDR